MKFKTPYADLLPQVVGDDFENLKSDIHEHGQRDPVILDQDNNVLDGHTRLRILGNKAKTVVVNVPEEEREAFALAVNFNRRQLTGEQRIELGKKRRKIAQGLAAKDGWTQERIARLLRVAQQTVAYWLSPKPTSNTSTGNASSRRDHREKLSKEEKEEVGRIVAEGRKTTEIAGIFGISQQRVSQLGRVYARKIEERELEEKARTERKNDGDGWTISDKDTVVPCAALITDPPYGILDEEWEPKKLETFTRAWALKWNECGADFACIFWSQRHLWRGRHWFDKCLSKYAFQHLLVWHYANNKSPQSRAGFKQTWEPIFFYRLKDSQKEILVDGTKWGGDLHDFDCHAASVPQSNFTGQDRKEHPAQKPVSVMRWLVGATTRPGELVCDPFCGSGTSGIAAMQLGRRFHGIETNAEFLKLAVGRVALYGKPKEVSE